MTPRAMARAKVNRGMREVTARFRRTASTQTRTQPLKCRTPEAIRHSTRHEGAARRANQAKRRTGSAAPPTAAGGECSSRGLPPERRRAQRTMKSSAADLPGRSTANRPSVRASIEVWEPVRPEESSHPSTGGHCTWGRAGRGLSLPSIPSRPNDRPGGECCLLSPPSRNGLKGGADREPSRSRRRRPAPNLDRVRAQQAPPRRRSPILGSRRIGKIPTSGGDRDCEQATGTRVSESDERQNLLCKLRLLRQQCKTKTDQILRMKPVRPRLKKRNASTH